MIFVKVTQEHRTPTCRQTCRTFMFGSSRYIMPPNTVQALHVLQASGHVSTWVKTSDAFWRERFVASTYIYFCDIGHCDVFQHCSNIRPRLTKSTTCCSRSVHHRIRPLSVVTSSVLLPGLDLREFTLTPLAQVEMTLMRWSHLWKKRRGPASMFRRL